MVTLLHCYIIGGICINKCSNVIMAVSCDPGG